jgi:hypothetical protein
MTVREKGLRRIAGVTTGLAAVSVAGVLTVATVAHAHSAARSTGSTTTGTDSGSTGTGTGTGTGTNSGPAISSDDSGGSGHATSGGS